MADETGRVSADASSTGGRGGFFNGMTSAIDDLVKAANTGGGFTVSDSGGQALLNAIDSYSAKLKKHLGKASVLTQQLPLGSSPAAKVFGPWQTTIAGDPNQGFIAAARHLLERLQDARAAIQKSMASYQETEQQNKSTFNG